MPDKTQKLVKFQIKQIDDPSFQITFVVDEQEDPETVALETLGYFILPEATIDKV